MHVMSLEIQNYLRVEAFEATMDGHHTIISARNGEGKTSIVNALFDGLKGMSLKDRPEPVHRGADKAYIKIDLGAYIVEKHINAEGKPRLVVTAEDGTKVTSPQKLLEGFLNAYSLDPVAFIHQRPQDQLDDVLKICGVKPPVKAVQEITGKTYPAKTGESADQYMHRLSADDVGVVYLERRDANRDVDTCRGAVTKQKDMLEGMRASTPKVRPAAEIMDEITVLEKKHAAHLEGRKAIDNLESEEREIKQLLGELTRSKDKHLASIHDAESQVVSHRKEIERLTRAIESEESGIVALKKSVGEIDERLGKGQVVVAKNADDLKATRLAVPPDQSAAIAAKRSEWKTANAQSEQVIKQQQGEQRLAELEGDLLAAKNTHDQLGRMLEELRQLRKDLLNGADFGVDGLSVGEGELLLHDVPFIQASQAQKLRVAAAVAMRTDAALKLLRIDNGELLDADSQRFLLELATEQGWQVIMTRVSNDKQLQVQIVDGDEEVQLG